MVTAGIGMHRPPQSKERGWRSKEDDRLTNNRCPSMSLQRDRGCPSARPIALLGDLPRVHDDTSILAPIQFTHSPRVPVWSISRMDA